MFKRTLAIVSLISILLGIAIILPTYCLAEDDIPPPASTATTEYLINETVETTHSEETIAPTEPEIDYEPLTLRRGFGYYKGSLPMSSITKVAFGNEHPVEYDEKWCANLSDTEEIVGYLIDTEVYIVGEKIYSHPTMGLMFAGCNSYNEPLWSSLREIEGLEFLDTSRTRDFDEVFLGNQHLTEIDLNCWDTSSAFSMEFMFSLCNNLETVYIEDWDVSNVRYFAAMFQGNNWSGDMKLKNIDLSKWDTSSAISMNHMFYGCGELENIDVSNWDVENVTTFSHMFADCYKLKSIDLTKWNTLSVISFDAMFNDCHSLTEIDISHLPTSTCEQFSQMFEACKNLTTIVGIEDLDVSNACDYAFSEMFHCCSSLQSLDLSKWNVSKADNMARMFAQCPKLVSLNISGWDVSNVITVLEMFKGSPNVQIEGMDDLDFSHANGVNNMY